VLDVESSKVINLETFVPRGDIDPVYLDSPYYLYPDAIAVEALRLIGAAIDRGGCRRDRYFRLRFDSQSLKSVLIRGSRSLASLLIDCPMCIQTAAVTSPAPKRRRCCGSPSAAPGLHL